MAILQALDLALADQVNQVGVLRAVEVVGRLGWGARTAATASATFSATSAASAGAGNAETKAGVVDADAASDKSVVPLNGQVVDGAAAVLGALHNGPQVAVLIHQTVVSAQRADLNEGVELVEHPVVRGGIEHRTAPQAVTHHALVFVDVNLEYRRLVQLALVVKAEHLIAGLQRLDGTQPIRRAHQRVPQEAPAATTCASKTCHQPVTCTVSTPAEITTEPTSVSP